MWETFVINCVSEMKSNTSTCSVSILPLNNISWYVDFTIGTNLVARHTGSKLVDMFLQISYVEGSCLKSPGTWDTKTRLVIDPFLGTRLIVGRDAGIFDIYLGYWMTCAAWLQPLTQFARDQLKQPSKLW